MKKSLKMLMIAVLVIVAASLFVSAKEDVVPGINVFTGTTAPFDFEGDVSNVVFGGAQGVDANGKTVNAVVVREDKNGNASNHAVSLKGNGGYFYLDVDFPVIDKDRPVKVSYDYILGLDGNQVRTLINFPTTFKTFEPASFNISYFGEEQKTEVWRNSTHTQSPGTKCKTGNTFYQGGKDMEFLAFVNYSGIAKASYFDNLMCMPYYKISFDANGGNGNVANEYFLQDAGTKYTVKTSGADVYRNGHAFKGWALTADSNDVVSEITVESGKDVTLFAVWEEDETVADKYFIELYDGDVLRKSYIVNEGDPLTLPEYEMTDGEFLLGWETSDGNTLVGYKFYPDSDLKLYAKWGEKKTLPGINIFENGTFEEDSIIDVRPSNGKTEIVSENGNKVLKYTRFSDYASIQHYVTWEPGRSYRIEFKIKTPVNVGVYTNSIYKDVPSSDHYSGVTSSANSWTTLTKKFTFPAESDSFTFKEDINDAISFYANAMSDVDDVVYFDDLVCIPYYKVTYNAVGGTGAPEGEYFLGDKYTVKTDAVPERAGYKFLGWTVKNGSVNTVTEVTPVPGKDIELFASWENLNSVNAVSYDFTSDDAGIANGTVTVTLTDETADYTSAEILFADNDGVLDNYTPFGTITFENGAGSYTVSGNRAFPKEVTRLAVKFIGEGLDSIYYWYTIPEEHRMVLPEKPIYSFWAVSDSHLGGTSYNSDYWPQMTPNRNNAFKDIFASDADFVFINGDVINYGSAAYTKVLDSYLKDRLNNPDYNTNNIPVFLLNGNHEYYDAGTVPFDYAAIEKSYNGQLDYLESTYGNDMKITRGADDELWYSVDYKGAKLIFLSSPQISPDRLDGSSFSYSEEQLNFLDEQLYEGEKSGKTTYVVSHAPLANTIISNSKGAFAGGISNTAKVNEILAKHPNVIFFSGHTHSDLSTDKGHFTVVNDMTTQPSHINDGCLVWLDAWDGLGEYENGTQTPYIKSFSTGVYLEVYGDKILVKSRKFMEESAYFGHGVYLIDIPDGSKETPDVTISGKAVAGETLSALVNGEVPSDDAPYTYEWHIGNNVVSTEKSFKVDIKGDYAGKKIALRVFFENGTYASAMSDTRFDGATITYDANGGTGTLPKSHTWVPGYSMQPDIGSYFPKKEGKFFIGWSSAKDAVKPETEVLIEGDTTLYAVYSDKPEFYFDANLSGFKSGAYTCEIDDGIVKITSPAGDHYFNWSNATFSADTYKYMRIKHKYVSGSGDGMFFGIDGGGLAQSRRMAISAGAVKAEMTTGFQVKEYEMSDLAEWKGTVTQLRYDALSNGGELYVDYVVFSEKMGVYKIDITSNGENSGSVSSDSHVTLNSISKSGKIITAVVTPKDGYEFTFADELETIAKINSNNITEAVINDDGTATLTLDMDNVVMTDASLVIGAGETVKYITNFGKNTGLCTLIAAAYNKDGRMVGAGVIKKANDVDGVVTVNVAKSLNSEYVKVMAFDMSGSFKVLAKEAVSYGNLIVNGDAEGPEVKAFYSDNANVSIVEDSEKGNVWEIVPTSGLWVYFMQKFDYVPGATYKLTADIKIVSAGGLTDVKSSINSNARYLDAKGARDHILSQTVLSAGQWVSVEHTFTIPADAPLSEKDEFSFYCNPISINGVNTGATYRIDNVDVQIIKNP